MLEIFAPYKWEALFQRWPDLLTAFGVTVGISVLALVIALVLGILFGVFSVSRLSVLRGITRVYVEVVQNVPLLLQVFVLYAIFPLVGLTLAAFWIGVLAIGIYHGGYMSEVVRSGIGSIHRGQFEAAKSQGFGYWQTMFLIILPQAFRIILPPLAVQAANLVKNTSVLALIAGGELMYFSNSFAGATSYYGPAYVMAAVLYFAICFPLSRAAVYLSWRPTRWKSRPARTTSRAALRPRRWRAAWAPCTRRWTSPRRGRPLRHVTPCMCWEKRAKAPEAAKRAPTSSTR